MSEKKTSRGLHACGCPACRQHPRSATAGEHRAINRLVASANERCRRQLAGLLARQHGYGGVSLMSRVTGLDRNTVARGLRELCGRESLAPGRIRRPGAGRKPTEIAAPGPYGPWRACSSMPPPATP